jgi:hypothetical protein
MATGVLHGTKASHAALAHILTGWPSEQTEETASIASCNEICWMVDPGRQTNGWNREDQNDQ